MNGFIYSYSQWFIVHKNNPTKIQDMSIRARLSRPCNYLCEQVAPVPVIHKRQISTRVPQPIYPISLPFEPPSEPPSSCPPTVVPIEVGEYPTGRIVKPGEILATMVDTLPTGYLWCNGQEVSRSTYYLLFSIIGTYYGDGDGEYTFNLPKLSNEINPNTRYIIKYNTYAEYTGGGGGGGDSGGGGATINPMLPMVSGAGQIQVLSYPSAFAPPPGTILYNTLNIIPDGYLACNGLDVSRSDYYFLFNMIGTVYGPGDGDTTFNLPNLSPVAAPYRYIIRHSLPENLYVEIKPNLGMNTVSLSGASNLVMK